MIKAKPVIEDQYWILQKNNIKIGQLKIDTDNKVEIKIYGSEPKKLNSLDELKKLGLIEFTKIKNSHDVMSNNVHGFPTDSIAFNAVWNMKYNLPLYTKSLKSKSWFAAGYYKISYNGTEVIEFCPKLITLERNKYKGPYKKKPSINEFDNIFQK